MENNNTPKDMFGDVSSQNNNGNKNKLDFISEGNARASSVEKMFQIGQMSDMLDSQHMKEEPEQSTTNKNKQKPSSEKVKNKNKKTKSSTGKRVVSFTLAVIMAVIGWASYHLIKKGISGQLATPLVNPEQNAIEETEQWPWYEQQVFEDVIKVEQAAKEMQVDLDKDETMIDAIIELEEYLYVAREIMNLKGFEEVIRNAEINGMEKTSAMQSNLFELIELYNSYKNVDVTDYSKEALEKTAAIKKLAIIYRACEKYLKSDKATDCLTSSIYLACSSFCGDQLELTPEQKAKHTIEVVKATEDNQNDELYMFYGQQKVQLGSAITKQINNIQLLSDTIKQQGKNYILTDADLDIMYDALNTAKKIVFTNPGESFFEASIEDGKKLVLRPNAYTIAKKTIDSINDKKDS